MFLEAALRIGLKDGGGRAYRIYRP